jgi:cytochrome c oxidase cbb3-type subunit 4
MDMGLLRGAITLLTLAAFIGICWWAYRPGNRDRFEQDGLMAFEDAEISNMESDVALSGSEEPK